MDTRFLHIFTQMFSVAVAVGVFMLTWNARRFIDNHYFLFLGISLLVVGIVDLLHSMVFDGWIGARGSYLDTRFWYAARYLLALSPGDRAPVRRAEDKPVTALLALIAAGAALAGSFAFAIPTGWFDPREHPRFIGALDLGLCGLGVAGYVLLRRERSHFDAEVYRRIVLSILLAIVSVVSEGLGIGGSRACPRSGICSWPCRSTCSTRC